MSVVADTSPLNYLVLIGQAGVLPVIFDRVIVPRAVCAELSHARASDVVRRWISSPPPWVEIATVDQPFNDPGLHPGEREVIALALERGIQRVLLDDRRARLVASSRGLRVSGLLGVLDAAAERRLIDLRQSLRALLATSFRCRPELVRELLDRQSRRERPL